ncbi:Hypothetical protein DEACI_0925 [Acididesulfobacillus acetoxydans]|uniref:Uncharacterized protein n=1 Tax=Acididesulfobacillus acetoxydans TaxID=1561005 RepID=A0A8S0VW06_9FIRM|nr:hypothetical protein [Acididesulfobacillus acetoxydans]CAA7600273.1 Hypothetical protein DEACI_0925 [Acididesulfobacillus acetoxydans]CEJ09651.1 Hypothetical protein DEACI_4136 [Acididesulfobacillus acetoxydans]
MSPQKPSGITSKSAKITSYSQLLCLTNAVTAYDGYFQVPISNLFTKEHPGLTINIRAPKRIAQRPIAYCEVHLNPLHHARFLEAEFVYKAGERARLQSIRDLQSIKGETHRLASIAYNRENFMRDYPRLPKQSRSFDFTGLSGQQDRAGIHLGK